MSREEKKRIVLPDLPDDARAAIENTDSVKGGAGAATQKDILFFDEADSLFGRKGKDKTLP